MSHAHNCPHCKSLDDPKEALARLQSCFRAVGDLVTATGGNTLNTVTADDLAALLGLLSDMQASAVNANFEAFAKLKKENDELKRLAAKGKKRSAS